MHPKAPPIELGGSGGYCAFRQQGHYVIDKTLFIQHVLEASYRSMLIPRPRRFGKTFNMATLRDFLERPTEPEHAEWIRAGFEGSKIWAEPSALEHFQKYPVLSFTFKDAKGLGWETAWSFIRFELVTMLDTHRVLLETPGALSQGQREWYQAGLDRTLSEDDYALLLRILSEALFRLYKTRVVILIDEYDTPIHAGLEHQYYPKAISFFKRFLGKGFKDNDYLFKGVLTGILRVSKENMFSDLNNIGVYSLLNDAFASDFGLTQEEVSQVLDDQGCPELRPDIEKMYNGYLFGTDPQVPIYNPWSTLSCIANPKHELATYWNNSGSPELLHALVVKNGPLIHQELQRLLDLGTLDVRVTENVDLMALERSPGDLYSFMLFTGYLKATQVKRDGDDWNVRLGLVNQELQTILTKLYRKWLLLGTSSDSTDPLLKAVLSGDATQLQARLATILLYSTSFLDGATRKPENFYQGLMLGLLVLLKKDYEVISNLESGTGRADLLLLPRTQGCVGVTMELKVVKEGGSHVDSLLAGLNQIQVKRYTARLEDRQASPIYAYAVAFDGKEVRVALETDRPALEQERLELQQQREASTRTRAVATFPVQPSMPSLDVTTQLDLEDRILPLLTPRDFERIWLRLNLPLLDLPRDDVPLGWSRLVSHCTAAGKLPAVATILTRQFPSLNEDPLMEKLRKASTAVR